MKLIICVAVFAVIIVSVLADPQGTQQQQRQQQQRRIQQQQKQAGAQQQGPAGAQQQRTAGAQQQRPAGAQQQRRPAAGQQQRRPGQQQGQRKRPGVQGGQTRVGVNNEVETVIGSDGKPLYLDPNLTLSKITDEQLTEFMSDAQAVNQLVTCFETLRRCRARAGVSLVRDVRSLGRGASCKDCDKDEQAHKRKLVGKAISLMQQKHPIEWRRVLPHIAFLL